MQFNVNLMEDIMKEKNNLSNTIISLEATCDLPKEIIKQKDFRVIDLQFLIDGKEYSSAEDDIVSCGLYQKMKNGAKTSTSQINKQLYVEFFQGLLKEGKDVLHLAFSSGLSQTCQSAIDASVEVNKGSKNKVYVIDSLCACAGQGLFAILAKEFLDDGNSIDETIVSLEKMKLNLSHVFSVDNLKYLANGGRIKKSSAIVGNVLHIKPVMKMDNAGHLVLVQKVISRRKAIKEIFNKYVETFDSKFSHCIISHADCYEDAKTLSQFIKDFRGIDCAITDLGPIIGSHSGPGTLALFFVAKSTR